MSESHREHVSALIDGAIGRSEAAFLLRRLEHDDELRGCYQRYHLIGDCLRGRAVAIGTVDLAAGVRVALTQEAALHRAMPWRGGLQWAAGLFTAAIVAAGAFWSVQPGPEGAAMLASGTAAESSEVQVSGVRIDDLRRQLPLLPVSARQSRPLGAREFAPQPDPEAWQRAPVTTLQYPSTHYIILVPQSQATAPVEPESAR